MSEDQQAYIAKLLHSVRQEQPLKKKGKRTADPSKPVWLTDAQKAALDSFGYSPQRIQQVRYHRSYYA